MEIDKSKCIICQQDKCEPLKCPLESFLTGREIFYSSVQRIGRLKYAMSCMHCNKV